MTDLTLLTNNVFSRLQPGRIVFGFAPLLDGKNKARPYLILKYSADIGVATAVALSSDVRTADRLVLPTVPGLQGWLTTNVTEFNSTHYPRRLATLILPPSTVAAVIEYLKERLF